MNFLPILEITKVKVRRIKKTQSSGLNPSMFDSILSTTNPTLGIDS